MGHFINCSEEEKEYDYSDYSVRYDDRKLDNVGLDAKFLEGLSDEEKIYGFQLFRRFLMVAQSHPERLSNSVNCDDNCTIKLPFFTPENKNITFDVNVNLVDFWCDYYNASTNYYNLIYAISSIGIEENGKFQELKGVSDKFKGLYLKSCTAQSEDEEMSFDTYWPEFFDLLVMNEGFTPEFAHQRIQEIRMEEIKEKEAEKVERDMLSLECKHGYVTRERASFKKVKREGRDDRE